MGMSSDDCATNSGYNSGNSGHGGGSTTYHSAKTAEESVAEAEKAVLDVFNPAMIVPAIFSSLFLYIGSGLTLKNVTEPRTLPAALTCLLHCDKPGGVSQPPGACGSASAHPPPPSPPAAG